MAVLGLVLGILALVVAGAPLVSGSVDPLILMAGNVWFSLLVLVTAALGAVLSVLGLRAAKRSGRAKGKAIAGLIVSIVPIAIMLALYTYVFTRPADTAGETKASQEDVKDSLEEALKAARQSTTK